MNTLYYGDNLDILRRYVNDESVDLIYLDPPFNSNATYNVLFAEQDGSRAAAQIKAFEDTWQWDRSAAEAYESAVESGDRIADAMIAFRKILGESNMLAYLSMMAPRLYELRRVLKPTGAVYLHCDPTASHYLKILMDAIFGVADFRNEITWKRTSAHSGAKRYGPVHDILLFYTKTDRYTWNEQYGPYDEQYIDSFFTHVDEDGERWTRTDLTGPGVRKGDSGLPWRTYDPTAKGRHWQPPSYFYEKYKELTGDDLARYPLIDRLERLDTAGLIHWPEKAGGMPRGRRFLKDAKGTPLQDVWTDIKIMHNLAAERLGYPTQKPITLMDRIITSSSNPGDVVLDPFCGCGTTIHAAQKLNREWIGIDITHIAIGLIKHRLLNAFGALEYAVIGEPTTIEDAQQLKTEDTFQFQAWALGLVGARNVSSASKGADRGIDGRLFFHDDTSGKSKQIIFSVKSGHVGVSHVRDLRGVLERENAEIGALLTLEPSTQPMRTEAASAGFYQTPLDATRYPRIQILTIEEVLGGATINYPARLDATFRKARRERPGPAKPQNLPF